MAPAPSASASASAATSSPRSPSRTSPAATAAALPPDDPLAERSSCHGFRVTRSPAVVSQRPQLSWTGYGHGAPDQSTDEAAMLAAHGGPFRAPVAIARAISFDPRPQRGNAHVVGQRGLQAVQEVRP